MLLRLSCCRTAGNCARNYGRHRPHLRLRTAGRSLCRTLRGDVRATLSAVNTEAADPTACGVATVAYARVADHAKVTNHDGSYQIVEILVVGIATPMGM